jgi:(p)ppGpp synthase/HD superfamily hydrolase
MATLEKAISIAVEAHKGQVDKNNQPFILHVLRVMIAGRNDDERILGALHDSIEKTHWTFEELKAEGFNNKILDSLVCVTKKNENEDSQAFIERIKTNRLAIKIKINDLMDHLNLKNMSEVKKKDVNRFNKYLKAYQELINL